MAYGVTLVFEGVGEEQYWAANEALGINPDGTGDWPEGLLTHAGGPSGTGLVVAEVWASKAAQEAFMAGRLGAALGSIGIPPPVQVIEYDAVNHHHVSA